MQIISCSKNSPPRVILKVHYTQHNSSQLDTVKSQMNSFCRITIIYSQYFLISSYHLRPVPLNDLISSCIPIQKSVYELFKLDVIQQSQKNE